MKEIPLTQGKVTLVDNDVWEWASKFKWCAAHGYAARHGKERLIYLHREIINPEKGFLVDHRDGDRLNNRRKNLRTANYSQNTGNSKLWTTNTSGYKGVSRSARRTPWKAQISIGGKRTYLGCFASKTDAARAYDAAAIKQYGEFAKVNFPYRPQRRND